MFRSVFYAFISNGGGHINSVSERFVDIEHEA